MSTFRLSCTVVLFGALWVPGSAGAQGLGNAISPVMPQLHDTRRTVIPPPSARGGGMRAPIVGLGPLPASMITRTGRHRLPQLGQRRDMPRTAPEGVWARNQDGEWYWTLGISADGAKGLRIHFRNFNIGAGQLWIHDGDPASGQVFGPYAGHGIFENGDFWTEIVFSETIYIDYRSPSGSAGDPPRFSIPEVYHLWSDPFPNAATNTSCFLDATCYAGNSWVGTFSKGVAYLIFHDHSCSGTLINDRNSTRTPYLITAGHCIADASEAASMVAIFGYRSATCDGAPVSPGRYPQVTGATLLAQNVHLAPNDSLVTDQPDYAFVRLTGYPNAEWASMGINFSPTAADRLTSISHPRGLAQRAAFGHLLDASDPNFFGIRMTQGAVDHGSSGSGLVNDSDQLVAVDSYSSNGEDVSACDISSRDYGYTRFSAIYPAIKTWIEAPPSGHSTITSPAPNSTLTATSVSFTWTSTGGATGYTLTIGTQVGGQDIFARDFGTATSGTGTGLPSDGSLLHVRLTTRFANSSAFEDYTYTSYSSSPNPSGLFFIPVTPCHLVDTRPNQGPAGSFGPPIMRGNETRMFIPSSGPCAGIPASAKAFSVTVTARPTKVMAYLTIFPAGQPRAQVSTLNAFLGGTVSNSAIVPAGDRGGINVYVTDEAHIALDINGYFDSVPSAAATAFYTLPPCRVVDTRNPNGPYGGPVLVGGSSRDFSIANSPCAPAQTRAAAYSLNVTVVPSEPLDNVVVWPSNSPKPASVITLGSPSKSFVADAAIVGSTNGAVSVYASNRTDVVLDTNGYFGAPGGAGALLFHPVPPCRIADTRDPTIRPLGGPMMNANQQRTFPVGASSCGIPAGVQAYSLNVTVVPPSALSFITLLPTGQARPLVSTLNDLQGVILANAAIIPAGRNDSVDVYVNQATHVILDINGYFSTR